MKKELLVLLCLFQIVFCYGQSYGESTVTRFGNNLSNWCSTREYSYRKNAQNQCERECRVSNTIMRDFRIKDNLNLNDNVIQHYLNGFQDALNKGTLNVSFNNVRTVSSAEQSYSTSIEAQEKIRSKNITTVATNVVITGALSYNVQDLYYVRNGKILKITPYEEVTDPKTGTKKVKVDFSDLVSVHSIELSYGYSSHYPLNLALHTNFSYFNIGVEYGQNFSNDPLCTVNHTNFATSTVKGKYYYLLASPGVYLHYASIDCGLGAAFTKYNYESVYSSYDKNNTHFMMKPKVTFHIPIFSSKYKGEKVYISPHVGYQYVPKFSKLNCWEFGLGVRVSFETY